MPNASEERQRVRTVTIAHCHVGDRLFRLMAYLPIGTHGPPPDPRIHRRSIPTGDGEFSPVPNDQEDPSHTSG